MESLSKFGIARTSGRLWSRVFRARPLPRPSGPCGGRVAFPVDDNLPTNGRGWWNLCSVDGCFWGWFSVRSGDPCAVATDVPGPVGVADGRMEFMVVVGMGVIGGSHESSRASRRVMGVESAGADDGGSAISLAIASSCRRSSPRAVSIASWSASRATSVPSPSERNFLHTSSSSSSIVGPRPGTNPSHIFIDAGWS